MNQTVNAPAPQIMERMFESGYLAPTSAVARRRRSVKGVTSAPAVTCAVPAAVIECVEYVAPAPAGTYAAPATVSEHVASTPAVTMRHQLQ